MEVGCGARVRDIGGRRYVCFWHYERGAGRSVRKEDDVGRGDSGRTRAELLRRRTSYHRKAERERVRRRAAIERLLAVAGRTSE